MCTPSASRCPKFRPFHATFALSSLPDAPSGGLATRLRLSLKTREDKHRNAGREKRSGSQRYLRSFHGLSEPGPLSSVHPLAFSRYLRKSGERWCAHAGLGTVSLRVVAGSLAWSIATTPSFAPPFMVERKSGRVSRRQVLRPWLREGCQRKESLRGDLLIRQINYPYPHPGPRLLDPQISRAGVFVLKPLPSAHSRSTIITTPAFIIMLKDTARLNCPGFVHHIPTSSCSPKRGASRGNRHGDSMNAPWRMLNGLKRVQSPALPAEITRSLDLPSSKLQPDSGSFTRRLHTL